MREYITNSEEETFAAAAEVASLLKAGDVILYKGEMGAGKTAAAAIDEYISEKNPEID